VRARRCAACRCDDRGAWHYAFSIVGHHMTETRSSGSLRTPSAIPASAASRRNSPPRRSKCHRVSPPSTHMAIDTVCGRPPGHPYFHCVRCHSRQGGGSTVRCSLFHATTLRQPVLSIRDAPCSPIIREAALVLADGIVGITEASMTLSPSTPWTRSSASTTELPSLPIRQVPH
jgi:hypothetical protein